MTRPPLTRGTETSACFGGFFEITLCVPPGLFPVASPAPCVAKSLPKDPLPSASRTERSERLFLTRGKIREFRSIEDYSYDSRRMSARLERNDKER